jgi:hypothetical protein
MATKASSAVYAPGEDPESLKANFEYQQALKKLTDSIDQRKNRFFDPVGLAAAQGFLAPGTSNFFDALGNVAGNINKAQEAEAKEEQNIAQMRLDLAGRGVELQRQKAKDAMWRSALGGESAPQGGLAAAAQPTTPGAGSGALPSGGQGAAGPLAQAASGSAPSGSPFMPGRQGPNKQQFFAAAQMENKPLHEAIKEWEAMQKGRIEIKDKFGVDTATGEIFMVPSGTTVPTQIFREDGTVGTYPIPENVAAQLSIYLRKGDADAYFELANKYTKGPQRLTAAPQAAAPSAATPGALAVPGAPAAAPQAAQAPQAAAPQAAAQTAAPEAAAVRRGLRSQEEIDAEKRRIEVEMAEEKRRAEDLAKAAAAKEAAAADTDETARRVFGSSTRILDYLKQSPNFYGIFARPGVVAAVGNLIKEGIQTPGGTLNLAGFEDSMRKLMPNVTQTDLDNVAKAAAELAEIELNFSRTYFKGQGAVTEGERKIVRAIPGSVSSSPEVLRTRVELLKARSQYDIDVIDAFRQWQEKNPGRSYLEFERKSDLYKEIKKGFEVETEKIFGGMRAVPTRERRAAPSGPQPSVGFIRDPATGVIRRKKPGE